jgi:hypothetical protein
LPSTFDIDEDLEDLSLIVRVSAKGEDSVERTYNIKIQKESYSLGFLSVESADEVTVGEVLPVDVVLQNNGHYSLDNVYVKVSIPELGISQKVYMGDIDTTEEEDSDDDYQDTVNRKVYLQIPSSATPGTYTVEVSGYNYDVGVIAKTNVVVKSVNSQVNTFCNYKSYRKGRINCI